MKLDFVAALFLTAGAMKLKLALLQIAPYGNDQNRNLAKGLQYCRNAKALGADLVVFPELWTVGSAQGRLLDRTEQRLWTSSAIDRHSTFFQCFADLARDLKMNIAITYLEVSNPKPRNSVSIINTRGDVVLNYSKVCICDFAPDAESGGGCAERRRTDCRAECLRLA